MMLERVEDALTADPLDEKGKKKLESLENLVSNVSRKFEDPSAVDLIIFTRNMSGSHWGVVYFWVNRRECFFYDGLSCSPVPAIMRLCLRFLSMVARNHNPIFDHFNPAVWTCDSFTGPQQSNDFDCGVFVIAFVHAIITGRDPNTSFGQQDMHSIRGKLAWLFTDPVRHIRQFQIDELHAIAERLHSENGIHRIDIPDNPFNPIVAVDDDETKPTPDSTSSTTSSSQRSKILRLMRSNA
jgi:hypothetical protein